MVDMERLYKRLMNRADLQGVPIIFIVRVCVALLEEFPECFLGGKHE